jgi:hypothetical protein
VQGWPAASRLPTGQSYAAYGPNSTKTTPCQGDVTHRYCWLDVFRPEDVPFQRPI